MERDVKRYDCNVTYWGGETGTESVYACVVWGERVIGTVHSTEFIQLNARRCVYTQGTLLPLLLLLFSMLLLFKWTCASSLFRHSVLARERTRVCVCAQCFFPYDFSVSCFWAAIAVVLFVLRRPLLPVLHGHTMHHSFMQKWHTARVWVRYGFSIARYHKWNMYVSVFERFHLML